MTSLLHTLSVLFVALSFGVTGIVDHAEHKFYLSVSKLNYNQSEEAFQLVSRVFIDDLELALKTRYGVALGLDTEAEQKVLAQSFIDRYLNSMLSLRVNDQEVALDFIGYTYEADQVLLLVEFKRPDPSPIARVEFRNRLLTDVFDEQQNLVHLTVLKFKKSSVLSRELDTFIWELSHL